MRRGRLRTFLGLLAIAWGYFNGERRNDVSACLALSVSQQSPEIHAFCKHSHGICLFWRVSYLPQNAISFLRTETMLWVMSLSFTVASRIQAPSVHLVTLGKSCDFPELHSSYAGRSRIPAWWVPWSLAHSRGWVNCGNCDSFLSRMQLHWLKTFEEVWWEHLLLWVSACETKRQVLEQ